MEPSKDPIYVVEDAAKVIFENISLKLKKKLTLSQIENIIMLADKFYESKGLVKKEKPSEEPKAEPIFIDPDELAKYLVNNREDIGLNLTFDEFSEILSAEEIYMRQIGIMD